jgi:4-hydroxy-2-oxoheptanedioate aldolase
MQMRESVVLKKLRAGKVVSCFKHNFSDSRIVEVAALCGFDCLWLCLEHVPNNWSVIEAQVLAAKTQNVDTVVRISRGAYSDYIKPLEMDATGIMVPHVMSAADARQVARTTRFHPVGRRPVDGGNADAAFCFVEFKSYLQQANDQRFVIIQIEDPEPLEELDEIAAVPGIDMLFFGPADFSHAIGAPGEWDDPRITAARKMVADTALRHHKFAGTVGSLETLDSLVALGYQFINLGSDVQGLGQHCQRLAGGFKNKIQ